MCRKSCVSCFCRTCTCGNTAEHNEELIQTVQELDPDLILLGGDIVTFPNPEYENMLSLSAALPMWPRCTGVLGNPRKRDDLRRGG